MRPASLRAALHGVGALLLLAACGDAAQAPTTAGGDTDAEPGMALFGGSGDAAHRRRACDGRKYHQFDFWLGKWNITTQGTPAGTNILRKELDGCAVMESYAAQGFVGRSLNSYDAATNRWHQHWVDHVGTVLDLFGSFQGGSMVLQGVRPTPAGNNNVDRITWTPLSEGVRQLWETSTDFGATFPGVQFDGLYERAATLVRDPEAPQQTCTDATLPALFQFDFTVGRWDVSVDGPFRPRKLRSRIAKDLSDCLIEERLSSHDGYEAIVFTSVRRRLGIWVKTLVDNEGTNVFLTGGLTDGKLVLQGTAPDGRGGAQDVRITYIQKTADKFEQRWEKSRNGGTSWERWLEVTYRR